MFDGVKKQDVRKNTALVEHVIHKSLMTNYKATGKGLIHKLCGQKLNVLSLCRMIGQIETANGVQTHF